MAETAVSFVLQELGQFAVEERASVAGIERDFNDIKDELESIQAFLKDADRMASDDGGGGGSNGFKTWVEQVREVSFRIEDVIDYYNMYLAEKASQSIFKSAIQMILGLNTILNTDHQIVSEIQGIKMSLSRIKERSTRFEFRSAYFIEETQVVGFESARDELVRYLVEGNKELMLVSVLGMGGLGKTTLAKHVFDNQLVKSSFDCRSFITVPQTYTIRRLLTEMIKKFCKEGNEPIPRGLQKMDDEALINQVRQYLVSKRYLVVFDDVWNDKFSDAIVRALINNNSGSRILVITRNMHVAEHSVRYFPVHVHLLQPLRPNEAWELFCNKAFRGRCPTELEEMSREIVQKCGGMPLAIVAIGGLLSTKAKTMFEWEKVSRNLRMELDRNVHLTSLVSILSLSYNDLPYRLKSCMIYFGIYPEEYTINWKSLTRQWMAEGFVRHEEAAEECLTELIQRSLVNVLRGGFDGKVESCQVHGLLNEVIIRKMKDLRH